EASGAPDALRLREEKRPDLMLIDIALDDGDGIDLIKRVRAIHPAQRMLVCSMHDERIYVASALKAGAAGYGSKTESADRLIEAIRRVLAGKFYLSPGMAEDFVQSMLSGGPDGTGRSGSDGLSDREVSVLRMIGDGMTSRQIARKLGLSIKTIETHREHI